MTKTECLLAIWTLWTITGPVGGIACAIFVSVTTKSFSKYIAIFRQIAKETLGEHGLDSYMTERGIEIYSMTLFIAFTALPIIGWVGFLKGIRGYIEGYKEGRKRAKHEES